MARLRIRQQTQRAGKRRRRARKAPVPPPKWPHGSRLRYSVALSALLRAVDEAVRTVLLPRLPAILGDALADIDRADAPADDADAATKALRAQLASEASDLRLGAMARDVAENAKASTRKSLGNHFKLALGFDPLPVAEDLAAHVEAFTLDNVRLIRGMVDTELTQIEGAVLRGVREGKRVRDVAREIQQIARVTKSRAELIAVDQIGSITGELTRVRQSKLGIERYRWSSSKDERVRPRHVELDGTVHSWSDPPVVDLRTGRTAHPGGDYRCRCAALPELGDVFALLGVEE